MATGAVYVGQRRSYAGALCTVRHHGLLPNTKGEWLGVEWDDPNRGKHDGRYDGQRIFRCLSASPTAASFVRASRNTDAPRTLLEAIRFKYAPTSKSGASIFDHGESTDDGVIEISGKVVEEVGFERIQKQLSMLQDLKIVLVDELVVSGITTRGEPAGVDVETAQSELRAACPNIVELDLGWNVVETWQDVRDMCAPLDRLRILKASGLRLREFVAHQAPSTPYVFHNLEELQLNESLLSTEHILSILSSETFPSLTTLTLSSNNLDDFEIPASFRHVKCPSITMVVLDNNRLRDLSSVAALVSIFPNLETLSLQGNTISGLGFDFAASSSTPCFPKIETLNLAGNEISEYSFLDAIPTLFPNLTSLRISRNPLYDQTAQSGEAGAVSDSTTYYLTLARIPLLRSLNYTHIVPRDREEGEIYYLSVAEKEIRQILDDMTPQVGLQSDQTTSSSSSPSADDRKRALALARHPLYPSLCVKYDRHDIVQRHLEMTSNRATATPSHNKSHPLDAYGPGTLGSRLVDAYFYVVGSHHPPFHRTLPTTISVYRLKSLVARHFFLPPLRFRLVYESHEYDPVEPITSTRNPGGGGGGPTEADSWAGWGDWDVDVDINVDHDPHQAEGEGHEEGERGAAGPPPVGGPGEPDSDVVQPANPKATPAYVMREGHRFKKRETEVLDGMRPWGDFLDLEAPDGTRSRDVRVRVEPQLVD